MVLPENAPVSIFHPVEWFGFPGLRWIFFKQILGRVVVLLGEDGLESFVGVFVFIPLEQQLAPIVRIESFGLLHFLKP